MPPRAHDSSSSRTPHPAPTLPILTHTTLGQLDTDTTPRGQLSYRDKAPSIRTETTVNTRASRPRPLSTGTPQASHTRQGNKRKIDQLNQDDEDESNASFRLGRKGERSDIDHDDDVSMRTITGSSARRKSGKSTRDVNLDSLDLQSVSTTRRRRRVQASPVKPPVAPSAGISQLHEIDALGEVDDPNEEDSRSGGDASPVDEGVKLLFNLSQSGIYNDTAGERMTGMGDTSAVATSMGKGSSGQAAGGLGGTSEVIDDGGGRSSMTKAVNPNLTEGLEDHIQDLKAGDGEMEDDDVGDEDDSEDDRVDFMEQPEEHADAKYLGRQKNAMVFQSQMFCVHQPHYSKEGLKEMEDLITSRHGILHPRILTLDEIELIPAPTIVLVMRPSAKHSAGGKRLQSWDKRIYPTQDMANRLRAMPRDTLDTVDPRRASILSRVEHVSSSSVVIRTQRTESNLSIRTRILQLGGVDILPEAKTRSIVDKSGSVPSGSAHRKIKVEKERQDTPLQDVEEESVVGSTKPPQKRIRKTNKPILHPDQGGNQKDWDRFQAIVENIDVMSTRQEYTRWLNTNVPALAPFDNLIARHLPFFQSRLEKFDARARRPCGVPEAHFPLSSLNLKAPFQSASESTPSLLHTDEGEVDGSRYSEAAHPETPGVKVAVGYPGLYGPSSGGVQLGDVCSSSGSCSEEYTGGCTRLSAGVDEEEKGIDYTGMSEFDDVPMGTIDAHASVPTRRMTDDHTVNPRLASGVLSGHLQTPASIELEDLDVSNLTSPLKSKQDERLDQWLAGTDPSGRRQTLAPSLISSIRAHHSELYSLIPTTEGVVLSDQLADLIYAKLLPQQQLPSTSFTIPEFCYSSTTTFVVYSSFSEKIGQPGREPQRLGNPSTIAVPEADRRIILIPYRSPENHGWGLIVGDPEEKRSLLVDMSGDIEAKGRAGELRKQAVESFKAACRTLGYELDRDPRRREIMLDDMIPPTWSLALLSHFVNRITRCGFSHEIGFRDIASDLGLNRLTLEKSTSDVARWRQGVGCTTRHIWRKLLYWLIFC